MKIEFKQCWSTIPPISTKQTTISLDLKSMDTIKDQDRWREKSRSWLGTGIKPWWGSGAYLRKIGPMASTKLCFTIIIY